MEELKMTKKSLKPQLDAISRSSGNRHQSCQWRHRIREIHQYNYADLMTSRVTLNSMPCRTADCIKMRLGILFPVILNLFLIATSIRIGREPRYLHRNRSSYPDSKHGDQVDVTLVRQIFVRSLWVGPFVWDFNVCGRPDYPSYF